MMLLKPHFEGTEIKICSDELPRDKHIKSIFEVVAVKPKIKPLTYLMNSQDKNKQLKTNHIWKGKHKRLKKVAQQKHEDNAPTFY